MQKPQALVLSVLLETIDQLLNKEIQNVKKTPLHAEKNEMLLEFQLESERTIDSKMQGGDFSKKVVMKNF